MITEKGYNEFTAKGFSLEKYSIWCVTSSMYRINDVQDRKVMILRHAPDVFFTGKVLS
jgi:hypothetical protein